MHLHHCTPGGLSHPHWYGSVTVRGARIVVDLGVAAPSPACEVAGGEAYRASCHAAALALEAVWDQVDGSDGDLLMPVPVLAGLIGVPRAWIQIGL